MSKLSWSHCKLGIALAALLVRPGAIVHADSLWTDQARGVISDQKASAIGDIVTILVQENNSASKDQSTKTARKSNVDASISTFLYGGGVNKLLTKGGQLPALKFGGSSDFDGGGTINNSETITARIAVRVIDVLPNGTMIVEGTRKTSFSGETQDAILRGVIRVADIQSNNSVYSYNVADATIKYVSNGAVSSVQKKRWITKVWDKVAPF